MIVKKPDKLTDNSIISIACDVCGKLSKVQYKSYKVLFKRRGMSICKSCACKERNKNPEYIKKITKKGAEHWMFGLTGKDNPHYGMKRSEETKAKIRAANKLIDGETMAVKRARKSAKTMRENGIYKKNAEKAALTKEKNNSWVVYGCNRYKDIYHRSSLELDFIKRKEACGEKIVNCNFSIKYKIKGKTRNYIPDFINEKTNTVYEIKSDYTWSEKTHRSKLKIKNIKKALYTMKSGYNYCLVLYVTTDRSNKKYAEPIFTYNPTLKQLKEML